MVAIQQSFDLIFSTGQKTTITNGEITKLKHDHLVYLGKMFDKNPSEIYQLEMECNSWRVAFSEKYIALSQKAKDWNDVVKLIKKFPKFKTSKLKKTDKRWEKSKIMMDTGFKVWDASSRMTPFKLRQNLTK